MAVSDQKQVGKVGVAFAAFVGLSLFPAWPWMTSIDQKNNKAVEGLSGVILLLSFVLLVYWMAKGRKEGKDILFGVPVPLAIGILLLYAFCCALWSTEYDKKFVSGK